MGSIQKERNINIILLRFQIIQSIFDYAFVLLFVSVVPVDVSSVDYVDFVDTFFSFFSYSFNFFINSRILNPFVYSYSQIPFSHSPTPYSYFPNPKFFY